MTPDTSVAKSTELVTACFTFLRDSIDKDPTLLNEAERKGFFLSTPIMMTELILELEPGYTDLIQSLIHRKLTTIEPSPEGRELIESIRTLLNSL